MTEGVFVKKLYGLLVCAPCGARTRDPKIKSLLLYQLS